MVCPKNFGKIWVMPNPDLDRLARYVKARRDELGLRQDELKDRGGPSTTTLTKVESASATLAPVTLRKLDDGLRWARGSAAAILAGGEPSFTYPNLPPPARQRDALPSLRPLSPETVDRLLTSARRVREALDGVVNAVDEPTIELRKAAESIAGAADVAAIESFGGAFEFARSLRALQEYITTTKGTLNANPPIPTSPDQTQSGASGAPSKGEEVTPPTPDPNSYELAGDEGPKGIPDELSEAEEPQVSPDDED